MSAPTICRACHGKIHNPNGQHCCDECGKFVLHLSAFTPPRQDITLKRIGFILAGNEIELQVTCKTIPTLTI